MDPQQQQQQQQQLPVELWGLVINNARFDVLFEMLGVGANARRFAIHTLNTVGEFYLDGTLNLFRFQHLINLGVIRIETVRSFVFQDITTTEENAELVRDVIWNVISSDQVQSMHFIGTNLDDLFPQQRLDAAGAQRNHPERITMPEIGSTVGSRIQFMNLCRYFSNTLQELQIYGLNNDVYLTPAYHHGDLATLLNVSFRDITSLTLHFSLNMEFNLNPVMVSLPGLQSLDLRNTSANQLLFNCTLQSPEDQGFPLQRLRVPSHDLTAELFNSLHLETRDLRSIIIWGSTNVGEFRDAAQSLVARQQASNTNRDLWMTRLLDTGAARDVATEIIETRIQDPQLVRYYLLNQQLTRLRFQGTTNVDLYIQHVQSAFPNITHLRLENCTLRHSRSIIDTGDWNLQLLELGRRRIMDQTMHIEVITRSNRMRFTYDADTARYQLAAANVVVPRLLVINAATLHVLRIYTPILGPHTLIIDNLVQQ